MEGSGYIPITKGNYAERVRGMKSLAPEWKTLEEAPFAVLRLLEAGAPFPLNDEKEYLEKHLKKEERNRLNIRALREKNPEEAEKTAENKIRQAWETEKFPADHPGLPLLHEVEKIIDYSFRNQYLCPQAFTCPSFSLLDHDPWKCKSTNMPNESLAFFGETAIKTELGFLLQRQYCHLGYFETVAYGNNLFTDTKKRQMQRLEAHYTSDETLGGCFDDLAFSRYLRQRDKYAEKTSTKAKANVIRALVGAVAVDSQWNPEDLKRTIHRMMTFTLPEPTFSQVYKYFGDNVPESVL